MNAHYQIWSLYIFIFQAIYMKATKRGAPCFPLSAPPPMNPPECAEVATQVAEGKMLLIDVREVAEAKASGVAKGAKLIPLSLLGLKADPKHPDCELPHGLPIAVYCASGGRSGMAADTLSRLGLWPGCQPWRPARLGGGRRRGRRVLIKSAAVGSFAKRGSQSPRRTGQRRRRQAPSGPRWPTARQGPGCPSSFPDCQVAPPPRRPGRGLRAWRSTRGSRRSLRPCTMPRAPDRRKPPATIPAPCPQNSHRSRKPGMATA